MNTRFHKKMTGFEALESRLAPAVTVLDATTVTYTDVDGDLVTVKVSTGNLNAKMFATKPTGLGEQLQLVDLSVGGFDGADLTITAAKKSSGDGFVNVGYINSSGHDLGKVTVDGDLGQIDAGDGDPGLPALKALRVESMGMYGLGTQAPGGSLESKIIGAFGKLSVAGDMAGNVNVNDGAEGTLGSVVIGGSLIGGKDFASGRVFSTGDMGPVKVGQDVLGGPGIGTGLIRTQGALASARVGGSLVGGAGGTSGLILTSGDMGPVRIGQDIQGGTAVDSGEVYSNGKLAKLVVGGSIIGGTADGTGWVSSSNDMGPVKIGA